jgi:hypothetical protein
MKGAIVLDENQGDRSFFYRRLRQINADGRLAICRRVSSVIYAN